MEKTIEQLLRELLDDKTLNHGQYFNLKAALEVRINEAVKHAKDLIENT